MTWGSAGSTVRPPLTPVSSQTATRVVQPARSTTVGRRRAAWRSRGLPSTPMVMTPRAHERGEPDGVAHSPQRPEHSPLLVLAMAMPVALALTGLWVLVIRSAMCRLTYCRAGRVVGRGIGRGTGARQDDGGLPVA